MSMMLLDIRVETYQEVLPWRLLPREVGPTSASRYMDTSGATAQLPVAQLLLEHHDLIRIQDLWRSTVGRESHLRICMLARSAPLVTTSELHRYTVVWMPDTADKLCLTLSVSSGS